MIQLLLAPYNDKEVQKLEVVLREALASVRKDWPCGVSCETCTYRHLCADLEKARKFAEEVRK